jgi:hypothetical protein
LIVAAILAGVAIWNRATQPSVPKFDPDARRQLVEQELRDLTPTQAFTLSNNYRLLAERGFVVFEPRERAAIEAHIAHQQFQRRIYWIITAIFAGAAAMIFFWPRGQAVARR